MCFWKWDDQRINIAPIKTKLKDRTIKQLKINESIKTLGVHVRPSVNRDDEYEHTKNKLIISIKKITRIEIKFIKLMCILMLTC